MYLTEWKWYVLLNILLKAHKIINRSIISGWKNILGFHIHLNLEEPFAPSDSNDATCAVVRVICIPLHAIFCCCPSISTVLDDSEIGSTIFMTFDHILEHQQFFACDGIQMAWTTA